MSTRPARYAPISAFFGGTEVALARGRSVSGDCQEGVRCVSVAARSCDLESKGLRGRSLASTIRLPDQLWPGTNLN